MSAMHAYDDELLYQVDREAPGVTHPIPPSRTSSGATTITRTVAIIKTHALNHRFEIERRIQEASFEIVKERQMEIDTETDPDTLYELFGDDADSLAEGPVWVYVLERRRAVEVWNTLMGDPDLEIARQTSPNSLRAIYGLSSHQNALMGSPDTNTAEIQIEALFASSPPFPTTDLPPEDSTGLIGDVTSSALEQMRLVAAAAGEDEGYEGYAPSSVTNPSTTGGGSSQGRLHPNGKPLLFRARAVPLTNEKPDIMPRTTKAAALRAGLQIEKKQTLGPRQPISKERQAQTFANVPGHKRNSTIPVASTAAPFIAPRMTRAATLRIGQTPVEAPARRRALTNEEKEATFEGVPGHKRRESIFAIASTAAPFIAPRMTKAATLRIGQTPVEAPARRRALTNDEKKATFEGVPGHKRRESIAVASVKAPTLAPRLNKSATLRVKKDLQKPPSSYMFKSPSMSRTASEGSGSNTSPPQAQTVRRPVSQASGFISSASSRAAIVSRSSSVLGTRSPSKTSNVIDSASPASPSLNGHKSPNGTNGNALLRPPSRLKPRPSSIAAPSITPRTNKSATLRAAKQEAEQLAAAKAAAKKASGSKPPPSSFKVVAA